MGNTSSSQALEVVNTIVQNSVSNVLNKSLNDSTESVNISEGAVININTSNPYGGKPGDICTDVIINQTSTANISQYTQLSNSTVENIKQTLQSDLQNKTSQLTKKIYDMMTSIGMNRNESQSQSVINRISQILTTNVTNVSVNRSAQSTLIQKQGEINIVTGGGSICCGSESTSTLCKNGIQISQATYLTLVSKSIASNIINSILDDQVLNRLVNDSSQTIQTEEKGLASIISSLTLPLIILGAVFIYGFFTTSKQGVQSLTKPKTMLTIVGIISAGLGLAYFLKVWPFKRKIPPQYWGCEKSPNGQNTGKCKQYDNATDGPFVSEAVCNQKLTDPNFPACSAYWGCEKNASGGFTGNCVTYDTPGDGPYYTQTQCTDDVRNHKACTQYWSCYIDQSSQNPSATCQEYPNPNVVPNSCPIVYDVSDCAKINCGQYASSSTGDCSTSG